jgi:hypothetical protein
MGFMSNSAVIDLDYVTQEVVSGQRMCGAAALCMIYRSLGARLSQSEVWHTISRPDARGNSCAPSYLLCADALQRGYVAMALQARTPWRVLQLAGANGIRLIVNYRMRLSARTGHFAVFVRVEENDIVLHDPQNGPARRIAQTEFLKLWQPGHCASEVSGNVLIAFSAAVNETAPCRLCRAPLPGSIRCPACSGIIPLQPGVVLGCAANGCTERSWERIFCPHCDAALKDLSTSLSGI